MPLYEYECKACGKVLEVRQKISDPAPTVCDACQQGPLVKLISKTSFVLKGNGWYVTDFRGGSTPAAASSGGESQAPSGGSKPAAEAPASTPSPAPKASN